jgi:hypothetical protein
MRDPIILFIHLAVTIARLFGPGGPRSVVAESLLVKHQLVILNRNRAHRGLAGAVPRQQPANPMRKTQCLDSYQLKSCCRDLYQLPVAARLIIRTAHVYSAPHWSPELTAAG